MARRHINHNNASSDESLGSLARKVVGLIGLAMLKKAFGQGHPVSNSSSQDSVSHSEGPAPTPYSTLIETGQANEARAREHGGDEAALRVHAANMRSAVETLDRNQAASAEMLKEQARALRS